MTIGHKAGHYCHFRVLRSANSDTGRKKKNDDRGEEKKKKKEGFWDLLGGGVTLQLEGAKGGDRTASGGGVRSSP